MVGSVLFYTMSYLLICTYFTCYRILANTLLRKSGSTSTFYISKPVHLCNLIPALIKCIFGIYLTQVVRNSKFLIPTSITFQNVIPIIISWKFYRLLPAPKRWQLTVDIPGSLSLRCLIITDRCNDVVRYTNYYSMLPVQWFLFL